MSTLHFGNDAIALNGKLLHVSKLEIDNIRDLQVKKYSIVIVDG
jgi:hypothetical protein